MLIAASGLRDKDIILEQMKQHQQQQAQAQQQAGQIAAQHGQAQIADLQAKAQANMALAKERNVNAVLHTHDAHRTFQGLPDDNATQVTRRRPPDPGANDTRPPVRTTCRSKQKRADTQKTHAETLLTAAKIPATAQSTLHTAAQTIHTVHQAHNVATTTNRLMRTPIPEPAPPGGAP